MVSLDIYKSLITSLIVQAITGFFEIFTLFINVPKPFSFLKQMMLLEIFVQFIEGSFYIYWLYNFKNILNVTPKRYFDWVITTPTMLINLIFYLIFLDYSDKKISDKLSFWGLFVKEYFTIITVLILNLIMLIFGYLTELSIIPRLLGVLLGSIPFLIYYYIIYKKYAILTIDGLKIYMYFFILWSLYGIVAMLPYKIKNICYNILDLFSKNFFGIFLTYLIFINRNHLHPLSTDFLI
jgi:bacteriorhodopsin